MAFTIQPYHQTTRSNGSLFYESSVYRRVQNSDIPVFICYGIIAVVGCVCNSITITIMARNPSLHTLYNFLLLNVAVADLTASVFSLAKFIIIFWIQQYGISDLSATLLCRFFTTIIYCSMVLSVTTLTAISLERYFGIVKPIVHRNMTAKRLKYFLILSWCFSITGSSIISGELRMDTTTYYCFFSPEEEDWPSWKWICGWIILTFAYIIPFIIITLVYVRIIKHMRRHNREPSQAINGSSQSAQIVAQKNAKILRLLILNTVIFSVAILPELVYFAMILSDRKYIDAALFYKIGIPTVAIIAINPFVYTLSNPTFRTAAQRLFLLPQRVRVVPLATRSTAQTTQ